MEAKTSAEFQLWIVDHLDYWRDLSVKALCGTGFSIRTYKEYSDLLSAPHSPGPDLILLGCVGSLPEERSLLQELARRRWHVVVFASRLTLTDVREFFHAGAADVYERPWTSTHLLSLLRADLPTVFGEPTQTLNGI